MDERSFYVYKCVVDDGGAPCVDDEILTLTICKPYIRSTAEPGDLIFAFGSNKETPANRLIYIAEVKRQLRGGAYFELDEFKSRQDCIYERTPMGRLERRADAKFHSHSEARISDLGEEAQYPKANALVADDFRYFGKIGTADWKSTSPDLQELVETLGQGHRVNFSPKLLDELLRLKTSIWTRYPHQRVLGAPLHAPNKSPETDDDEAVKVCATGCRYIPKRC